MPRAPKVTPPKTTPPPATRAREVVQTATLERLHNKKQLHNDRNTVLSSKHMLKDDKHLTPDFPGARAMKLPIEEAVEKFLWLNYKKKILNKTLCMSDLRTLPLLYQAILNYKKRYKKSPYGIPSTHDKAVERFNKVISLGYNNAPRRDRDAANRITKKLLKTADI